MLFQLKRKEVQTKHNNLDKEVAQTKTPSIKKDISNNLKKCF